MQDLREEIHFVITQTSCDNGAFTYFQFWLQAGLETDNWLWDEGKWSLEEALKKYPLDVYKWVSIHPDG